MKISLTFIALLFFTITYGQTKIVTGNSHAIFVELPKNWIQVQSENLPLFIKPNEPNVSVNTYMYVYGLDYSSKPDMNGWIKGDIDDFKNKHPGMRVDSLQMDLPNLKKIGYQTGNYKVITYTYENKTKQAILVIECRKTIATVVLSANDNDEFIKYLPAFKAIASTVNVMGGTVKIEKQ